MVFWRLRERRAIARSEAVLNDPSPGNPLPMSLQAEESRDPTDASRLLAGAARTVKRARYCWLVTAAEDGIANLRPMGRLLPAADEGTDEWTIRFITDGRSHKARDIRREDKVAIIFQHDADDAFASLTGKARWFESESDVRERWRDAYDALVPTAEDRANAIFVDVEIQRMELWIRGVTAEPFGFRATILERDAGASWHVVG